MGNYGILFFRSIDINSLRENKELLFFRSIDINSLRENKELLCFSFLLILIPCGK